MITRMPRSCVVHRAALLDFVDGQPRTAESAAALSHLERCRACEEELAGIVRTVAALRRLGESVDGAEPSAEVWARVRARAVRTTQRGWISRVNTASSLLAVSIVAAMSLSLGALPRAGAPAPPAPVSRLDAFEPRIVRQPRADLTVYASAPVEPAGNPQAPDGDRGNLAGISAQSASGGDPATSVSSMIAARTTRRRTPSMEVETAHRQTAGDQVDNGSTGSP
jgi:anti-sigma factor RsiW